jgi:large subunit ribosomal protein L6
MKAKITGRKGYSLLNTTKSIMKNMIIGLQKGYFYKMAIVYSHFPINVQQKGDYIEINNFCGEKRPRKAKIFGNTKVKIQGKEIILEGLSKEDVSLTASNLEKATKVKNKDRRVFQDGIYIVSKGVLE